MIILVGELILNRVDEGEFAHWRAAYSAVPHATSPAGSPDHVLSGQLTRGMDRSVP